MTADASFTIRLIIEFVCPISFDAALYRLHLTTGGGRDLGDHIMLGCIDEDTRLRWIN